MLKPDDTLSVFNMSLAIPYSLVVLISLSNSALIDVLLCFGQNSKNDLKKY